MYVRTCILVQEFILVCTRRRTRAVLRYIRRTEGATNVYIEVGSNLNTPLTSTQVSGLLDMELDILLMRAIKEMHKYMHTYMLYICFGGPSNNHHSLL